MSDRFSLKDHLFNAETLGQLADECAAGLPGFDRDAFLATALPGLADRQLKARIDWIADCLEPYLSPQFATMADQLEAAMPLPLDTSRTDDDFGQFIHAVPGVLAVRHGLAPDALPRALDLLEQATQRFSMEFYIRPFLSAYPDVVMARLALWARHDVYHLRRLVSEGTRPNLPWAGKLGLDPWQMLPLLDHLHADPTRYVTRSVANHLNDLSKIDAQRVVDVLADWQRRGQQTPEELNWMTRHALRSVVKKGHPGALRLLGFEPDTPVTVERFALVPDAPAIGETARVEVVLSAPERSALLVDYAIWFKRPGGCESAKVHKIGQAMVGPGHPATLAKGHWFKGDATTYSLVPGVHRMALQVNGRVLAETRFDLRPARA